MDTLVGNVILTGVLVVALVIFVVSAAEMSQYYSLQVDRTLLGREATYVAQSVQQLYLAANASEANQSVLLELSMPEPLGNHAYTLTVSASTPSGTDETNLTVVAALSGSTLDAASSVVVGGRCTVSSKTPLIFYPTLAVELTLVWAGGQQGCSIVFG